MKKEKIILYKSTETVFTHNGIRVLKPLQCTINRNLVDYTYDLDMVYPIDDTGYWKDIIEDRIIKANGQLFRIVHTDKSVIDNSITIYAKHIFFDLQKNFIEDTNVVVKNGNIALAQLLGATSFQHNFTGYSDIAKQNNFRCVRQNVLDALLGDQDTSFINRWGGEFDVDNFNIKMVNQVGSDKGYKIKYGRNLTGLNFRTDYTNIITRIRPVGFDGIDLGDNNYVDSPNINNYSMPIIREMKYEHVKWSGSPNYEAPDENDEDDNSVVFDDLELARAELRRLASLEFTENEVDLPEINCEVNFVELSNTEEYSQFRNLEKISLGDIVTIEHKPLDINIKARCISYVYDCLKQQYESIEIGHCQKNFFRETLNTNEKMENNDFDISEEIQSVYAQAISKMTEMMNNSMNGYVVLTNSEILIMDSPNKKEAKNVWKFNSSGIAHSSTGYDGEYTVGMTMDGHINGALITAGSIKGDMIEAGTITTRELAVEIQTTINSAMTQETTQALITANLNQFESNLSQTFITEEEATKQIQDATEVAVEQATQEIVNTSVERAMESVNDQLDNKLSDYTTNTMNPTLQQAMQETLQDSKDYVVEVTGNYYTKSDTDSIISQTREQIELGVSSKYETKENTSIKITEAIDGVTVGAINRVFGTAEEKTFTFNGGSNHNHDFYEISTDIADKEVIISFEYDLEATVENGSQLRYETRYASTSNVITYIGYNFLLWKSPQKISLKNQKFSFKTTHNAMKQDAFMRIRSDGVAGKFTIRKAQIKVGNKVTEWSIAPEDIESNANNYTIQQLKSYYTKTQTDSRINIMKEEINLGVSSLNESLVKIETNVNNMQISGRNIHGNSAPSVVKGTEGWRLSGDGSLSLIDETNAPEGKAIKWVANTDGVNGFYNYNKSTEIIKGKRYSSSFWIKASRSMKVNCGCEKGGTKNIDVTTSWQKITHTFTANDYQYSAFVFYVNNASTVIKKGDTIYVHSIKLEEGDKPTEWSYAPEDISSNVSKSISSTIANYYTKTETDSKINVAKESIELGVSNKYETITNVETKIGAITVGGENLLLDTSTPKKVTGNNSENQCPIKYTFTDSDKHLCGLANTDITLSFEYSVSSGAKGTFKIQADGRYSSSLNEAEGYWVDLSNIIDVSKNPSGKIVKTTRITNSSSVGFKGVQLRMDGFNGTLTISKIKIERGNKATDWSPNPKDIETSANNYTSTQLKNYYTKTETNSAINVAKNEINAGVSSTYETKTNTTTKVNNALSQAKSYSDTKKNEAITSANNTLNTTISNYYTKQQTDSQINIAKDSIKSEVSNTYYTKNEISSSGAVNLIKNGGFEQDLKYWTSNQSPSFNLNQSWQNYDGKSLFISTDNYGDGIYQYFKTEIGKTYTYSFYAQCEKCEFTVGVENRHFQKVAVSPNKWTYYKGTFTATANNHAFIIYNMNQNTQGNIFIDNIMVNEGIIPAKYTASYSEVYESIANNTSLINQTASTIRSEISSSFSSYYNKNETDNKIYNATSSVTQTINDLKIQFSQSGGYNLFKNSKFHGGNSFWRNHSYNSPSGGVAYMGYADSWGFPDKEVNTIYYTLPVGKSGVEWGLAQTVETTVGKQYTISFYYASHRCDSANIIVRRSDSTWLAHRNFNPSNYSGGNSSVNNWGRQVFTFTATETSHTINIVMNNCSDSSTTGYLWIAKPQCEEGSVATAWSPHPNEVMTGITTISENGITVSHSNANTTSSMDASGFRITRVSDSKNIFNATNGNLTMEGVLSTGSSGKRIVVSDSNYKVYDGNTQKAFFGLRSNDGYISPMLSLSADAIGTTAYDGFSINMYKRNNNPSSSTVDYMDMSYLVSGIGDYSNIKMFGDGNMRIAPVNYLDISTNWHNGVYNNPSGYEYVIARFTSSSSSYYNARLEIDAIVNTDLTSNGQGLVLEDSRGGVYSSVTVYVNPSTGQRTFRPVTNQTGTVYNGTSNALWKVVYSANGTIQTSDRRYKAITDDTDIYDCFKMVKNTKLHNYVMLDKNKEKMTQIELAESALFNVGEESSVQIGVMAQDLLNYKCGKQIVVHEDIKDDDGNIIDDIYSVNAYPFASAVMGGLQYEIKQREELSNIVLDLYQTVLDLQQRIKDLEEK